MVITQSILPSRQPRWPLYRRTSSTKWIYRYPQWWETKICTVITDLDAFEEQTIYLVAIILVSKLVFQSGSRYGTVGTPQGRNTEFYELERTCWEQLPFLCHFRAFLMVDWSTGGVCRHFLWQSCSPALSVFDVPMQTVPMQMELNSC